MAAPATKTLAPAVVAAPATAAGGSFGGQYRDDWVQSKTIFALMSASECACCGFSVSALALSDLMSACSDIETTTAADSGVDRKSNAAAGAGAVSGAAVDTGVWPIFVAEKIWSDRVALRQRLKQRTATYSQVWSEHRPALERWWSGVALSVRRVLCCIPVSTLHRSFSGEYGLGDAYTCVLIAVSEQLEHFNETGYATDGVSAAECAFEAAMDVFGLPTGAGGAEIDCFGLIDEYLAGTNECKSTEAATASADGGGVVCSIFHRLTESTLHLLPKAVKQKKPVIPYYPPATATTASLPASKPTPASVAPRSSTRSGFRADRRLARLILYRSMLDQIFTAFLKARTPAAAAGATATAAPAVTIAASGPAPAPAS